MRIKDLIRFIKLSHLGYKSKYSDSTIGTLWIPISNLFLVGILVAIFGSNDPSEIWNYAAYISVGYITWGFLSDTINGHSDVFRAKRNELNAPDVSVHEVFVKSLVERAYLLLFNLIFLSFLFLNQLFENISQFLFFPLALIFLIVQSYYLSLIFSILTLFLPDVRRVLANITRILFFASPIFWGFGGELSGARGYFYQYNPITYYLELMRYSLGASISMEPWHAMNVTVCFIVVTMALALIALRAMPNYLRNIQ